MLPRELKLSVEDFPKRSKTCFRGKTISLKSAPNGKGHVRLGVLVGKGVSPRATLRNWTKRTIYDVFEGKYQEKLAGFDLLVIVGGRIAEESAEIKEALKKEVVASIRSLERK